jgi:peptide/nickel transport system substrate-binding protein
MPSWCWSKPSSAPVLRNRADDRVGCWRPTPSRAFLGRTLACALLLASLATPSAAQGTLRLLASSAAGSIDPQINYTAQFWQVFAPVYDGLVAFRKVQGTAGTEIVPDLADRVEQDGLIYRFHLRPGLRFSDGSPLRPVDVVASFHRIFRVGSPTAETFYGIVDGAADCLKDPERCPLPGVRAEGDTIVITTTRPDPEFLQKLALPHASVLPADAPAHDAGTIPLPGTGPWRIAQYDPNDALLLERNPFFHPWNAEAQPDAIPDAVRYEFGLEPEAEVSSVLNDQADWMYDGVPPDRLAEVAARPALAHLNPAPAIMFVPLNVHEPPFVDIRVRRAFNLAVDRDAVVRLVGGSGMATPLCQVVPPGLPGHTPYCPYTHDLAQARHLVAESGTAGQAVTLVVDDAATSRAVGTYLVQVLTDIGYRARLQALSGNVQFSYIENSSNHVQASLTGWYADYPSAANIIAGNFGCAAFRPGSDNSTNIPGFCDPALDTKLLTGRPDDIAAVDRAITDQAPAVILYAPRYLDLVSPRIRGFTYHETWRWLMQRARLP